MTRRLAPRSLVGRHLHSGHHHPALAGKGYLNTARWTERGLERG
jgi:hypothetical protein